MTTVPRSLAAVTAAPGPPIVIGRDEAQRDAARELARRVYHQHDPNLIARALSWVISKLIRLWRDATDVAPHGWAGLAALVGVAALVVLAWWRWVGVPARTRRRRGDGPLPEQVLGPGEHRAAAAAHAEAERWAEAVREALRALIGSLQERALLEPRAGMTAAEAAQAAGQALPACARDLLAAARAFDDVWYGGRSATRADYELLHAVDERVGAAKPVLAGDRAS